MSHIIIQLGTNIGDRFENLRKAILLLGAKCNILQSSSIYETAAWGVKDQQVFYNQLIRIETSLSPYKLLEFCQEIEELMGRVREYHWGPRIIDLDIIFYRNKIIFGPDLEIPHKLLQDRRFILEPLQEIDAEMNHPIYHLTCRELLANCSDNSEVKRL